MAALWERFRGTTVERVDTLDAAIEVLRSTPDAAEPRIAGSSAAHKLAGSLGTFGFPEASRLARECERILDADAPLGPAELDLLAAHAAAIRAGLD